MSFVSLLVVAGLLAVIGVVVAQAVPTVIEYQAVKKAANKARDGNTVAEVHSIFDKAASIDNISISGKDIEVTKKKMTRWWSGSLTSVKFPGWPRLSNAQIRRAIPLKTQVLVWTILV